MVQFTNIGNGMPMLVNQSVTCVGELDLFDMPRPEPPFTIILLLAIFELKTNGFLQQ